MKLLRLKYIRENKPFEFFCNIIYFIIEWHLGKLKRPQEHFYTKQITFNVVLVKIMVILVKISLRL